MANFISSLTGTQLNDALNQVNQRVPEGWAVGEKDGIPVSSSSPYYQNNAKYYAENALDSANRAEAAVPAGTAGAVFFDRSQSLTDAQAMQARANIVAGGSNPNLFMNPWFTINQRNASGNLANGYRMDRWKIFVSGGTVNFNSSTRIVTLSATSNVAYIQQILDPNLRSALNGKTVTFSVLTSANAVHSVTFTYSSTATDTGISFPSNEHYKYWYGGDYASCLRVDTGTGVGTITLAIKAIKLELGSVSTIANDMPPDYGEELARCQRYFVRIKGSYGSIGAGVNFNETTGIANCPLPATMRATPSITKSGTLYLSDTANHIVTSYSVNMATANAVTIQAITSGLTAGNAHILRFLDTTSYIDLSADL